jgi:phosphate transport system protein
MERRLERELESLKTSLIKMGSVVEEVFGLAIRAVLDRKEDLAQKVIEADERINSMELEIDNAILDLLALQQPVASDLRFILAAQKINNDLERIGDHAVNIAESAQALSRKSEAEMLREIPQMAAMTNTMLREALDSFIQLNPPMAQTVLKTDDEVDDLNRLVARRVIELVKDDTRTIEGGLELIRISRNLERVADLTTNIAEEVLFEAEARVVKHHAEEKKDTHHENYREP